MMHKKNRGFTLVEIILVTLLISIIGVSIYHVFIQGLRVWKRASKNHAEVDVYLGLEKMNNDLRNAMKYGNQKFKGTNNSMQFYSQESTISHPGPIRVNYRYDELQKNVRRGKSNYTDILNNAQISSEEAVLSNVHSILFSYYLSGQKNVDPWKLYWDDTCLPEAVKVTVDYSDGNDITKQAVRTMILPAGGCAL